MASKIPLHCNICPKRPSFSDVSHLLTHIASKGHLSCYYRIKVKSSSDSQCAAQLQQYDQWYTQYDVEDLMSERMSLKDKKNKDKPKGFARSVARAGPVNSPTSHHPRDNSRHGSAARSSSSFRPSPASSYDPRLDHISIVKHEPRDPIPLGAMDIPVLRHPHPAFHTAYHFRPSPVPRGFHYSMDQSAYNEPDASDRGGYAIYPDLSQNSNYEDQVSSVPSTNSIPVDVSDDELPATEEGGARQPKLKGTFYDGMSIFDSATPVDRRRRNQKKDDSVLRKLEDNSLSVEPTESIWTPGGTLKKQKEINGLPSSSSPMKSPAKAWRPSLTDINPRQLNNSNFDPNGVSKPLSRQDADNPSQHNAHAARKKKKRPLDVYHDVEEHSQQHSFEQPMTMTHLTRGITAVNETDDMDSRPARRRQRLDGRLENLPYENPLMSSYYPDPAAMQIKQEEQEQSLANSRLRGSMNASERFNAALSYHASNHARTALVDPFLVPGTNLNSRYNNSSLYGNSQPLPARLHGTNNRRSVGSIPIEDLINNYPPSHPSMFASHAFGYPHPAMHFGMNHQAQAMSANPASEWQNFWATSQTHNHGNPQSHSFWQQYDMADRHVSAEKAKQGGGMLAEDSEPSVGDRPTPAKASRNHPSGTLNGNGGVREFQEAEKMADKFLAEREKDQQHGRPVSSEDDGRTISTPTSPTKNGSH